MQCLVSWDTCTHYYYSEMHGQWSSSLKADTHVTGIYTIMTCGWVKVQLHLFLDLTLEEGEWSAVHPGCFHYGERALSTHWIGCWVGSRPSLDTLWKRKISCLCQEFNYNFSVIQPVVYMLYQPHYPISFRSTNKQNDNVLQDGTHWWHQQLLCQFVCIQRQGQSRKASFHEYVLTQVPDGELKQSVWHHHDSMEATRHHLLGLHFAEIQSQTLKSNSRYTLCVNFISLYIGSEFCMPTEFNEVTHTISYV